MRDHCVVLLRLQVPESVLVEFAGEPPFGVQGKDVMLYTLGQLKCNTVRHPASDRA
jgi:homoaconitase/3-isopropylmalate dehydratase large subunit